MITTAGQLPGTGRPLRTIDDIEYYRTVRIRAGHQTPTAADPPSDDLHQALANINPPGSAL